MPRKVWIRDKDGVMQYVREGSFPTKTEREQWEILRKKLTEARWLPGSVVDLIDYLWEQDEEYDRHDFGDVVEAYEALERLRDAADAALARFGRVRMANLLEDKARTRDPEEMASFMAKAAELRGGAT